MQPEITDEQRAALRAIGDAGRARRRRIEHVCPVCGVTFTGLVQAVTCSNRCRTARLRQQAKAKQQP